MVLQLTVRRFFCDRVDCRTGTFVEQDPGLTERYSRRTADLQQALVSSALALAGRAGSRFAAALGSPVSLALPAHWTEAPPDATAGGQGGFAIRRRAETLVVAT